ncbi:MAG: hypothetical protein IPI95_07140 [Flavobacteriales bacterium]|nr:hypothetical protein [Flavobacteriales bacterium]
MNPKNLGELKKSGWKPRTVKQELRANLIARIRAKHPLFEGIHGYADTVVPAMERAILAGHSINLLGLRGQAKTRMARSLVQLLDEWMPVVEGSELNDDPFAPVSRYAKDLVAAKGDATPITWMHRDERYTEKLATPDVTATNRGAIITPLKDRIQSQILTHYPESIELGMKITAQEMRSSEEQRATVDVPDLMRVLVERIAMEARDSEFVDRKSGVSARLAIGALESVVSAAERRALYNNEQHTMVRIGDLFAVVPAITGKIELVYEGRTGGTGESGPAPDRPRATETFKDYFPDPSPKRRSATAADPYAEVVNWFNENETDVLLDGDAMSYRAALEAVGGLPKVLKLQKSTVAEAERSVWMEFVLHGLAEHSRIGRNNFTTGVRFGDVLNSVLSDDADDDEEDAADPFGLQ